MSSILVLHGPNLNMLGLREPGIYGTFTIEDVNRKIESLAKQLGISLSVFQSNHEGVIVDAIHEAFVRHAGILINAGAYSHTIVAIRDAILAVGIPAVEVHISNVYKRDKFRHHSYLADIVVGQISGFGIESYTLGLRVLASHIGKAL